MISVSIVGGSGYTGGEVLRLLLSHPRVELFQVTSESRAGKFVHSVHPNLRKRCKLRFVASHALEKVDLLFLCLPHGMAMNRMEEFLDLGRRVIDLSSDFRLRSPADYVTWYRHEHSKPELLAKAVYGIPELHRQEIREAASGDRCRLPGHGGHSGALPALQGGPGRFRGYLHRGQGGLVCGRQQVQCGFPPPGAQRLPPVLSADRPSSHGRGPAGAGSRRGQAPDSFVGHLHRFGAGRPGHGPGPDRSSPGRENPLAHLSGSLPGRSPFSESSRNDPVSTAIPNPRSWRAPTTATSASSWTRRKDGWWCFPPWTT